MVDGDDSSEILDALDFHGETAQIESRPQSRVQLAGGRLLDIVISGLGGLLALPLGVILAALVKFTSSGPVLFRQTRVGRNGELFTVLKFRTMQDGTHVSILEDEAEHSAYMENDFKLHPDDPRITTIGRFLRKTSLDELPQLVNVLCGQMCIVGIRPLLPVELALRPDRDQTLYRSMRPGMTGLWQVEGRSTVAHGNRFELDRRYVETWSLWNDLKILLRTPFAVLRIGHAH